LRRERFISSQVALSSVSSAQGSGEGEAQPRAQRLDRDVARPEHEIARHGPCLSILIMSEKRFRYSPPGRLACLTLAVALVGAGATSIVGPRSSSFALIGLAIGLYPVAAMFTVFVAPKELVLRAVVLFARCIVLTPVYVAALWLLQDVGSKPLGVALLALSLLPILVTLGVLHGSEDEPSSTGPHGLRKWLGSTPGGAGDHIHGTP
jgi:hypothetical protein